MRFLIPAVATAALLALPISPALIAPAMAQATSAPDAGAPANASPDTSSPAPLTTQRHTAKPHGRRMSMHQRFAAANTTKDGHLTLDQANAAKWTYVARHFDAMDAGHKGYVTEADIHAYAHAQYLARHAAKTNPPATSAPTAPAPAAPAPAPAPSAPPAAAAPATPAPAQ